MSVSMCCSRVKIRGMKVLELAATSSSYSYSTSTSGSGSESDSCKKNKKEKKEKKEEKKMCESSEEERVEPENFKAMKASPHYMEIDAEEEEEPEPPKVVLSEAPRAAGDRNKAPPEGAPEKVPCVYCGKYISDTPNARWQHEVYGTCKKRRVAHARDWEKGEEASTSSAGHKDDPWASRHGGGEKPKGWEAHRSSQRSRSPLLRRARPTPPPGPPPATLTPTAKAQASRGSGSRGSQGVNDVLANFMMSMGQVLKLGSDVPPP